MNDEWSAATKDVLFCTDHLANRHAGRLAADAHRLEVVRLVPGETLADEHISRITMAFFSHDAWPDHAPAFMSVALGAPRLSWLHTMSAGVDHPIFSMLLDNGVRVTTSSGASARPIAATVMMYLLALSRGLPRLMRAQAERRWEPERYAELAGQPLAVVGYGPIGREVCRLADAFGMLPTIVRRTARGDEPYPVRPLTEVAEAVSPAAAVVLALPLTEETRGLFDARLLAAMRDDAYFVNVGRGELVDQAALTSALAAGRLGGAGLDVFDPEPLPSDDPLWGDPNVIITPHSSGSTDATARVVDEIFFDNLGRWWRGDTLRNEVP